jgi:hypothetical protein
VAARSTRSNEAEPASSNVCVADDFGSLIRRSSSNLSALSGAQEGSEYIESTKPIVAESSSRGPSALALRKHKKLLKMLTK